MTRIPIPKFNRPNEFRPISLCNDIFCFINDVMAAFTSDKMEKANILHKGIAAYRKGKGCAMLVSSEVGIREDSLESTIPSCWYEEDDEKFFDRIPVEISLAAHKLAGFPDIGWIELKGSCLWRKPVNILTDVGTVKSCFSCGIEQGSPDSPRQANLVARMKHLAWQLYNADIQRSYIFNSKDDLDGQISVLAMGFSDDNSIALNNINEQELFQDIKGYIRASGNLSMITKIGRRGDKCKLVFHNLSVNTILNMPIFESIA